MSGKGYAIRPDQQNKFLKTIIFQKPTIALGVLLAFTAITACSEAKYNDPPIPTLTTQPAERYPEIGLYYPDLRNFNIQESGEIRTPRSSTKWFNLTSSKFDPAIAGQTIAYFEKLNTKVNNLRYSFNNQSIPIALDLKPNRNRVIFLIPPQAPNPNWPDANSSATTTGVFENVFVSFIRINNQQQDASRSTVVTTTDLAGNKPLAVEICQSTMLVGSSNTNMANLGQEIFCNSWGNAFALKQYGLDYKQYYQWAKNTGIRANAQSPTYPLLIVSESDYQQIPMVGPIVKN